MIHVNVGEQGEKAFREKNGCYRCSLEPVAEICLQGCRRSMRQRRLFLNCFRDGIKNASCLMGL